MKVALIIIGVLVALVMVGFALLMIYSFLERVILLIAPEATGGYKTGLIFGLLFVIMILGGIRK